MCNVKGAAIIPYSLEFALEGPQRSRNKPRLEFRLLK